MHQVSNSRVIKLNLIPPLNLTFKMLNNNALTGIFEKLKIVLDHKEKV